MAEKDAISSAVQWRVSFFYFCFEGIEWSSKWLFWKGHSEPLTFIKISIKFSQPHTNLHQVLFLTKSSVYSVVPYVKAVHNPNCHFQCIICILYEIHGYPRLKEWRSMKHPSAISCLLLLWQINPFYQVPRHWFHFQVLVLWMKWNSSFLSHTWVAQHAAFPFIRLPSSLK